MVAMPSSQSLLFAAIIRLQYIFGLTEKRQLQLFQHPAVGSVGDRRSEGRVKCFSFSKRVHNEHDDMIIDVCDNQLRRWRRGGQETRRSPHWDESSRPLRDACTISSTAF